MKDTAGNEIHEKPICTCGLTGGCEKCMPKSYTVTLPAKHVPYATKSSLNNKTCRACQKPFHWCSSCGTIDDLEEELCPNCCDKLGIGLKGLGNALYRSL